MRLEARLVIIGAGIVGASAAYHLAQLGWRDVIVVDQGPLFETGGSTSHAPGLMFQTNASKMMTEFARYSVSLYDSLSFAGQPAFYKVGGIEVAYTKERWHDLKRKQGIATAYNLEAHLISPAEVRQLIPILNEKVIHGGYYVPSDGDAKAVRAVAALAREAKAMGGVEFYGHTTVTDIEVKNGRVQAVVTDQGRIATEAILLCTNIWAPVLAAKLGIKLPLMAVEHQYLITEPIAELAGERREIVHPVLRHQDVAMYFRQHADAYGVGSYKHKPLLVSPWELGQEAKRPFTPEHFAVAQQATDELLPPLKGKGYVTRFNGMFAFTTDGMPILGPAPAVKGFWTAVGVWVTHGGGAGQAMAEWMTGGAPGIDVREADISRFHDHVYSRNYIQARCAQQYREVYDIIHPLQQMEKPRNLRLSPFHQRLQEQQGAFFESVGWERPQWFEANNQWLEKYAGHIPERQGWAARYWSPIQGAEHLATRENVAMYDVTAFTKIEVTGPGALAFLERLAANKIDQPAGKVIYTALLNHKGGIMADLTITRWREDRFWVLTGGGAGMHDLAWLRQNAPDDGSVTIANITSRYGGIGLWGPKARQLLQGVCEEDVANEAFPYFTAQPVMIDTVPAFALRVSYAGELGWEIYAPAEHGLRLWDVLWEAGRPHGVIAAGGGAFDSLRLEKGYRLWGADIHSEYNPYEAGLGWAVRLNKGDFIGREALLRMKDQGITRQLCCLTFDDPEAMALGKEPILDGGRTLGYVTSANYGYSVGKHIVYGYLPLEYASEGVQVEVMYFGQRYKATVVNEPLYDPHMSKLKT
jgi:glycine cleavage system T protein